MPQNRVWNLIILLLSCALQWLTRCGKQGPLCLGFNHTVCILPHNMMGVSLNIIHRLTWINTWSFSLMVFVVIHTIFHDVGFPQFVFSLGWSLTFSVWYFKSHGSTFQLSIGYLFPLGRCLSVPSVSWILPMVSDSFPPDILTEGGGCWIWGVFLLFRVLAVLVGMGCSVGGPARHQTKD